MKSKTLKVDYLARVEGEGGLLIRIRDGEAAEVKLKIFEPPRFFEALLRGRKFSEAPDITARICGICPVAYQMCAVHAMESAFGVRVGEQLRALRRLIYLGEWIESHALHVFLLHAPDFLGYEDAIRMAKDHPAVVERGLRLKKTGNELVAVVGGREIHPVNVRVGGFYKAPGRRSLFPLRERLERAREEALETVRWAAGLSFPDFERDYHFVALRHPAEYPLNEGRLVSNKGLEIPVEKYEEHFVEEQVPHSHALHSTLKGGGEYIVGPIARYNLNFDRLSALAQEAARSAGLASVCRNPFKSILIRCVELLHACDEAIGIIEGYEEPEPPALATEPRPATGYSCTEAPRGILYHRYVVDGGGLIREAKIVPPTAQNQKVIESDLREFVTRYSVMPEDELLWRCEQAVRNYDPCISCATHLLRPRIVRG
ncbi:MAG: Ni/Fe hydrogenase subunit alpha [Bacillota bacterium]